MEAALWQHRYVLAQEGTVCTQMAEEFLISLPINAKHLAHLTPRYYLNSQYGASYSISLIYLYRTLLWLCLQRSRWMMRSLMTKRRMKMRSVSTLITCLCQPKAGLGQLAAHGCVSWEHTWLLTAHLQQLSAHVCKCLYKLIACAYIEHTSLCFIPQYVWLSLQHTTVLIHNNNACISIFVFVHNTRLRQRYSMCVSHHITSVSVLKHHVCFCSLYMFVSAQSTHVFHLTIVSWHLSIQLLPGSRPHYIKQISLQSCQIVCFSYVLESVKNRYFWILPTLRRTKMLWRLI